MKINKMSDLKYDGNASLISIMGQTTILSAAKICLKLLIVITSVRACIIAQSHGQRRDSINGPRLPIKYNVHISNELPSLHKF